MRRLAIVLTVMVLAFDPGSVFAGCSGTGNGGDGTLQTAELTCRGTCTGSTCESHQMMDSGDYYLVCSCSATSESDCCHLILNLTGPGGSPDGWGKSGDCPSCGTTGFCTLQMMQDDTQVGCVPGAPQ